MKSNYTKQETSGSSLSKYVKLNCRAVCEWSVKTPITITDTKEIIPLIKAKNYKSDSIREPNRDSFNRKTDSGMTDSHSL